MKHKIIIGALAASTIALVASVLSASNDRHEAQEALEWSQAETDFFAEELQAARAVIAELQED